MKNIFCILLCLSLSAKLQAKELTFSVGQGAIIQEISALVLREAYSELGIAIAIKVMPNARALKAANKGQVDGDVSRIKGINKRFKHLLAIPVEINYLEAYGFSKNKNIKPRQWSDLLNYRVVSVLGIRFVEKNFKKHGIEASYVPSFAQAMTLVARERADVAVFPDIVGLTAIEKAQTPAVKMRGAPLIRLGLFHYLHQNHAELVEPLTQVLKQMAKNGRISAIREQFMKNKGFIES